MTVVAELKAPNGKQAPRPVASKAPQPFPLVSVRDIQEIVTQEFLVEGILPMTPEGSVGYLFAPEKSRKSLWLAEVALCVALKTQALGRYEVKHSGSVVGFFAEDAKAETARRMKRLARGRGCDVPENVFLLDVPSLDLTDIAQQRRLMATLMSISDLRFAWFDPAVRIFGGLNDNYAHELAPVHDFLRSLARACPSAVIAFAHHATKATGGARGSTDYPALGDWNLFARKPDDLTTEVYRIDNRGGPPGTPFSFAVEDGASEAGPTMRLVAQDASDRNQERDAAVEEQIVAFKETHPGESANACRKHLRALGIAIGNDKFWDLWRSA